MATAPRGARPTYKVVLIGDIGVGKTSIFIRVRDGVFQQICPSTIRTDSCVKTYPADAGKKVKVCLWDTAGTEQYNTITRNYYRNTRACLLVYSLTCVKSLYSLSKWLDDINKQAPQAIKILIGNKKDLQDDLQGDRSMEIISSFAIQHKCDCLFFASAKTGESINEIMMTAVKKIEEAKEREMESKFFLDDYRRVTKTSPTTKCSC